MTEIDSYPGAIEFLYGLRWFGIKLGRENTLRLAELAGHPQQALRFIHVAGTNGKGSTCAMLESIYRAAGLRVGLFTSPHLVSFRERLQVNRRLIAERDVVRLVEELQPWLKEFPEDHRPTFFEVVTVLALRYFAEQKCDLVIWETGLGGRLDATNIVVPLASVITNVQYDHQQWLGDTLTRIAVEKAGIIKDRVPVITAADEPEALQVIERVAAEKNAPLVKVTAASATCNREAPAFPLAGEHQKINAALALATVQALQNRIPVSAAAIQAGLAAVNWPGRLQLIVRPSGQKILLDGAHNVAGAEVLAAALKAIFPSERSTLVLGILQDKNWAGMCEVLAPLATRILLVPVNSERAAAPQDLAEVCRKANPHAQIAIYGSLSEVLPENVSDPFVVVTGTLYLIGEAMGLLDLLPATVRDERGLNEWGGGRTSEPARRL
jgi:dihydrofolate synthase / folylpolyglutamate synthase